MTTMTLTYSDSFGDETTLTGIPARFEVCPTCEGSGTVDHPAFSNGITGSEWAEWDQDEREDYLRGRYDVPCGQCNGQRVVEVPDVARCDYATKRELAQARRALRAQAEADAYIRAEEAAERRFGC
jgi:hypothetical protein